jgi:hypothetical protein
VRIPHRPVLPPKLFSIYLKRIGVRLTLDQHHVLRFEGPQFDGIYLDGQLNRLHLKVQDLWGRRVSKEHLCDLIDATATKIETKDDPCE